MQSTNKTQMTYFDVDGDVADGFSVYRSDDKLKWKPLFSFDKRFGRFDANVDIGWMHCEA